MGRIAFSSFGVWVYRSLVVVSVSLPRGWVYSRTGISVCHDMPASRFTRCTIVWDLVVDCWVLCAVRFVLFGFYSLDVNCSTEIFSLVEYSGCLSFI